jgi:Tfp pilus assembly protein PilN
MKAPNQLSFLPDDYLERKAQRRTNAICATLFLVVMVMIGTAFTFTERSMRAVERDHADVERQYTEAARRIQQVQQMQDKQRTMAIQAELTSSLLEKVPRSFLLAEVTNAMPTGVSLLDLALESKKRAAPKDGGGSKSTFEQKKSTPAPARKKPGDGGALGAEPRIYDVYVRVTGVAATDVQVAQFISRLNVSKLLRDVNLVISDEYKSGDEQLRRFQIEMTVNPDAEVSSLEKPKVTAVELQAK